MPSIGTTTVSWTMTGRHLLGRKASHESNAEDALHQASTNCETTQAGIALAIAHFSKSWTDYKASANTGPLSKPSASSIFETSGDISEPNAHCKRGLRALSRAQAITDRVCQPQCVLLVSAKMATCSLVRTQSASTHAAKGAIAEVWPNL